MDYVGILISACLCGEGIAAYTAYLLKHTEEEYTYKGGVARYLIIIAVNLLVWLFLYLNIGFTYKFFLYALASLALLGLSVVDLAIYEIPVQFNYFILCMGIIAAVLDWRRWYVYLIGMFLVSGIFYLLAWITKGRGMGGGDIKLMAALGLLLGWQKILLVMTLGCILGIVIHGILMIVSKKEHMLAFGPYLSAAGVIVMCYGDGILQWYIQTFLIFE